MGSSHGVHPLVLLTLASLLAVLFGIAGLMLARSRQPSETERRAAHGVAGLKSLIQAGDWRAALPPLLVTGGLLGVMVFGAFSLALVFGQRTTGVLMLGVAVFALVRVARDYMRA